MAVVEYQVVFYEKVHLDLYHYALMILKVKDQSLILMQSTIGLLLQVKYKFQVDQDLILLVDVYLLILVWTKNFKLSLALYHINLWFEIKFCYFFCFSNSNNLIIKIFNIIQYFLMKNGLLDNPWCLCKFNTK